MRYTLHVTKACNMQCSYCYEDNIGTHTTLDEAQKVLSKIDGNYELEFLGGEPLLNMNLIEDIEALYGNQITRYIVTTNGTLLDERHINFLNKIKHKLLLTVSLDGNKFMNSWRVFKPVHGNYKGSFEIVTKNIDTLIELGFTPLIHMVIHPFNVGWLSYGVKQLAARGYKRFEFGIAENFKTLDEEFRERYISESLELHKAIQDGLDIEITNFYEPKLGDKEYIKTDDGRVILETKNESDTQDFINSISVDMYNMVRKEESLNDNSN